MKFLASASGERKQFLIVFLSKWLLMVILALSHSVRADSVTASSGKVPKIVIEYDEDPPLQIRHQLSDLLKQLEIWLMDLYPRGLKVHASMKKHPAQSCLIKKEDTKVIELGLEPFALAPAVLLHEIGHEIFDQLVNIVYQGHAASLCTIHELLAKEVAEEQAVITSSTQYVAIADERDRAREAMKTAGRGRLEEALVFREQMLKKEDELLGLFRRRNEFLQLRQLLGPYEELFADFMPILFYGDGSIVARVTDGFPPTGSVPSNPREIRHRDATGVSSLALWSSSLPEGVSPTRYFDYARAVIFRWIREKLKSGSQPSAIFKALARAFQKHIQLNIVRGEVTHTRELAARHQQELLRFVWAEFRADRLARGQTGRCHIQLVPAGP